MTQQIKAIETVYKNYRFRSRLEAKWAYFFDLIGIKYTYEQDGYQLPSGEWYLPDFFLLDRKEFVEIKPQNDLPRKKFKRIYLAGKMKDWRRGLNLKGNLHCGPNVDDGHNGGSHIGCLCGIDLEYIVSCCTKQITECDTLFAWIDSPDCYGAIAEIGYASALGKTVVCCFSPSVLEHVGGKSNYLYEADELESPRAHDLWFVGALATVSYVCDSPQEGLDLYCGELDDEEKLCAQLSAKHPVLLCRGDPFEENISTFDAGRIKLFGAGLGRFLSDRLSSQEIREAAIKARQARFEHGETPRV